MSKYVSPDVLNKVKEMDLITYFKNYNPNELVKKVTMFIQQKRTIV